MTSAFSIILTLAVLLIGFTFAINNRPVIGILTIPSSFTSRPPENYSYFPASYAKFVESVGARVIPIPYDAPFENITFLLNQINGVIFTGGGANKTARYENGTKGPSDLSKAAAHILNHVLEANKKGENFPLWATCMGMEILPMALSNTWTLTTTLPAQNHAQSPITFYNDARENSKLWGSLPPELKFYAMTSPAFHYHHKNVIYPYKFLTAPVIPQVLKITAISYPAAGGSPFIAAYEGIEYPIFGTQFHPEKLAFEWMPQVKAPHYTDAMDLARRMAHTFVNEARKNNRKFISNEILQNSLLANWDFSQRSSSFMQVYLFRTVLQEPTSWPALFNLPKQNKTPVTKISARPKGSSYDDEE